MAMGVNYRDRVARTHAGWTITARRTVKLWHRGPFPPLARPNHADSEPWRVPMTDSSSQAHCTVRATAVDTIPVADGRGVVG